LNILCTAGDLSKPLRFEVRIGHRFEALKQAMGEFGSFRRRKRENLGEETLCSRHGG